MKRESKHAKMRLIERALARRMTRLLPWLAMAAAMLAPGVLRAQNQAFLGTWKLNLSQSKYSGAEPPRSQTCTVEAQGNAVKYTYDGIAADGSPFSYSFTSNLDGNPAPVIGSGVPGDADMITSKRTKPNISAATLSKGGKRVFRTQTVVSDDGKTFTVTEKGSANGNSVNIVAVYDKQ